MVRSSTPSLAVAITAALAVGGLGSVRDAHAHPGQPGSRSLGVDPEAASHVVVGSTVGTLITTDGGTTWRWLCETAVPYGGTYLPDIAMAPGGAVLFTSFQGVRRTVDHGCTVEGAGDLGPVFASTITVAADGAILAGLSEAGNTTVTPPIAPDRRVVRSVDGGATFTGVTLGPGNESWSSIEAAPSDPMRVYLAGARVLGAGEKDLLLFRSDDGGASFDALSIAAFAITPRSLLEIAAIDPADPDRVLLRVTWWSDVIGDAFYLTTNGGATWTRVLELEDAAPSAVFRASGEAIVATRQSGILRSTDGGQTFAPVTGALPRFVYCMHELAGELWVCTDNNEAPPFDYNVMRTTDLVTWTPVMRFTEIAGPVECGAGTVQRECCACHSSACTADSSQTWEWLAGTIGNPNAAQCAIDGEQPDAGRPDDPPASCCGAGAGGQSLLLLLALLPFALRRPSR